MSVDFSGRWIMNPRSDPFLPGIEKGTVALRIDHIDPLLQIRIIPSAPGYALGHFVLNLRTDDVQVETRTHGMELQTNAVWQEPEELLVSASIRMGRYERHFRWSWRLTDVGKTLLVRHVDGELAGRTAVFQQQPLAS